MQHVINGKFRKVGRDFWVSSYQYSSLNLKQKLESKRQFLSARLHTMWLSAAPAEFWF